MSDDDTTENESLARSRSRRTKSDKSGKLAAFERLKNLRGSKNKYEVAEVKNVYDIVDEDTYVETVNDRLKNDWIVDDGTGYCENGLELFDDDMDEEEAAWQRNSKKAKESKQKKKQSKEEKESAKAGFQSVRDMLTSMPQKRKRHEAGESSAIDGKDEDLLGDLMQELHEEKKAKIAPSSSKFIEMTHAKEKLLESSRIKEAPFASSSKVIAKRKFQAYKVSEAPVVEIKEEPEDFASTSHDFDEGSFPSGFDDDDDTFLQSTSVTENEVMVIKTENATETNAESKVEAGKEKTIANGMSKVEQSIKKESPKITYNVNSIDNFQSYVKAESSPLTLCDRSDQTLSYMMDKNADSENVLNFYWLDINEEPRNPGHLYAFGKVQVSNQNYASCCVVLKNVQRVIYLLPREKDSNDKEIEFMDVYNEFNNVIAPKYKINAFKSRRVEKKYCFGLTDVPAFSEYLEVQYSGTIPALPDDLQGKTFSRIFGSTSPLLENFLLEKQLKGPSWLHLRNPHQVETGQQHSWCKFEFTCDVADLTLNPDKDKLATPPLVLVSLNIQTVPDTTSRKDTIVAVGVAVNRRFEMNTSQNTEGLFHDHFILLNKAPGCVWPFDIDKYTNKTTTKIDSERSMLGLLLAKLQQIDADAYVGHDINFELLLFHLISHKVANWSRVGRLRRSTHLQKSGKMLDTRSLVAGRLVCDVKVSAMELIRARSYDLASLGCQILGMKEDALPAYVGSEIRMFFDSSEGIRHFVGWTMEQCLINIKLVNQLQVLPLAMQITAIAGNTLSRTLMGGRSERNEFLLLHAFYTKGYIVPDKYQWSAKKIKREGQDEDDKKGGKSSGPSYAGGLVLDPKKGFYDNFIVLMDFNSLYPSIIQEFNVCFTTSFSDENSSGDDTQKGVLPEEIRKLVESRKQVKRLMQGDNVSSQLKTQYDIRQKALKLTANSMYGCLGFRNSRFYAKELAAYITGKGREILLKTKETVEKMGFDVIYGDTDSIMINSNSQEVQKVYQIGQKIKAEINKQYRLLELEIDGIFRFMLLLKKKKYAALVYTPKPNGVVETTMELKGLDMVRRDWAPVAGATAKLILDEIMSEQPLDDKIYKSVKILNDVAGQLRGGNVPLKDLMITKQLAKNPEEYKDPQGLYHVQVALRMNSSGKLPKKYKNGDTVSYIFCNDGLAHHVIEVGTPIVKEVKVEPGNTTTSSASEENKPEVKTEPEILQPDPAYYLSQQIHPVVSRICEPIPGLDAARIAECLGMDPTSYKKRRVVEDNNDDNYLGEETEKEKYRDCAKFSFVCVNKECQKEIVVESLFTGSGDQISYSLLNCPGCKEITFKHTNRICNQLSLYIRRLVSNYYKNLFVCEDPSCTNVDRRVPVKLFKGYPPCRCKQALMYKEYTDAQLQKQLNFLLYLFDYHKQVEKLTDMEKAMINAINTEMSLKENVYPIEAFKKLCKVVQDTLDRSGYSEIDLNKIFADLMVKRGLV